MQYIKSPQPTLIHAPCTRVRLFQRGNSISTESKRRKLKREYKQTNQLLHFIYWTDIGREGALKFEAELKQQQMAQKIVESLGDSISVEKAQKMIRKSVEAQKEANAVRVRFARSARTSPPSQQRRRTPQYNRGRSSPSSGRSNRRQSNSSRSRNSSSSRRTPSRSSTPRS